MTQVVVVTGCCGFIGRVVARKFLERGDFVYGVDALTYAADPAVPKEYAERWPDRWRFEHADIATLPRLPDCDVLVNCAAETHVDNSIRDPSAFLQSNVLGLYHLLELVRGKRDYAMPHVLQFSTDEVYGDVGSGSTPETAPLHPSSPYAASKAAADLLLQAYGRTFDVSYNIVRPSNCYGAHQYPEKLIPKCVRHIVLGRQIPLHEEGRAERSWLWVEDCADAVLLVLDRGVANETYNMGGNTSLSARAIAALIVEHMGANPHETLAFGHTRLGLDKRYHVNDAKLWALGWRPQGNLQRDLPTLVEAERQTFRW